MTGTVLILPAAGSGSRFGGAIPKQLRDLAGVPVIRRSVDAFAGLVDEAVVPVGAAQREAVAQALAGSSVPVRLVDGGSTRLASVYAGLLAVGSGCARVLVHDAVRPLVPRSCIEACLAGLLGHVGCVVALPCPDTVKRVDDQGRRVVDTLARESLWLAQTPQGLRLAEALPAFAQAVAEGWSCSDDVQVLERAGHCVAVVKGDRRNLKITTPEDLGLAQALLAALASQP